MIDVVVSIVMLIVSQSLTRAIENTGQTYNDIGQMFEKQVSVLVCVFVPECLYASIVWHGGLSVRVLGL